MLAVITVALKNHVGRLVFMAACVFWQRIVLFITLTWLDTGWIFVRVHKRGDLRVFSLWDVCVFDQFFSPENFYPER